MLLDLADQLDSLRTVSPQPKGGAPRLGDKDGPKGETPKKSGLVNTEDMAQRNSTNLTRRRVNQGTTSAEKSLASSTCEPECELQYQQVGHSAVAQACFSAAGMTKVVEDTHNSKVEEALLARQCLEKVLLRQ